MRMLNLRRLLLGLVIGLSGCASTPDPGAGHYLFGQTIQPLQKRVVVGGIVDKTGRDTSVGRVFSSGIQDLLITALFEADHYSVLEREALDEILLEQEFSQTATVGEASALPRGQLQGAELLLVGAITAFDDKAEGGLAFPIPIPMSRGWVNLALLDLKMRRGFVSMDLRLIDVTTGQIVQATAVEGKASRFGLDVSYLNLKHDIKLPGVLNVYANTPVETALRKMVDAAIEAMDEAQKQASAQALAPKLPSALPLEETEIVTRGPRVR